MLIQPRMVTSSPVVVDGTSPSACPANGSGTANPSHSRTSDEHVPTLLGHPVVEVLREGVVTDAIVGVGQPGDASDVGCSCPVPLVGGQKALHVGVGGRDDLEVAGHPV